MKKLHPKLITFLLVITCSAMIYSFYAFIKGLYSHVWIGFILLLVVYLFLQRVNKK